MCQEHYTYIIILFNLVTSCQGENYYLHFIDEETHTGLYLKPGFWTHFLKYRPLSILLSILRPVS